MKIGFTTSIPIEILFAAGHVPIDLNNIFINNNPFEKVKNAELYGFPANICAWIKGMYSVVKNNDIDLIIGVVQGDCSNAISLMTILKDEGYNVLNFSYPQDNDNLELLNKEIEKLVRYFHVTRKETEKIKKKLDRIRKKIIYLDELSYKTGQVSSWENHYWQINSTDFQGDYIKFENDLDEFINLAQKRKKRSFNLRLGFIGVPPIILDFYEIFDNLNVSVIYNEIQRQFSMCYLKKNILLQYSAFTYPKNIFCRLDDIKYEIQNRKIDGIISYTQSFCHRQLDFISIKKHLNIPILQLEADKPEKIDARNRLRIESFIEIIYENK